LVRRLEAELGPLPKPPGVPPFIENSPQPELAAESYVRMLFSCLVDTDRLDTAHWSDAIWRGPCGVERVAGAVETAVGERVGGESDRAVGGAAGRVGGGQLGAGNGGSGSGLSAGSPRADGLSRRPTPERTAGQWGGGSDLRAVSVSAQRTGQSWSPSGDEALLCLDTFWRNERWHLRLPHTSPANLSKN
jgi:hypothetical protein